MVDLTRRPETCFGLKSRPSAAGSFRSLPHDSLPTMFQILPSPRLFLLFFTYKSSCSSSTFPAHASTLFTRPSGLLRQQLTLLCVAIRHPQPSRYFTAASFFFFTEHARRGDWREGRDKPLPSQQETQGLPHP